MIEVDCRKCVNCTGEECISLEQALKAEYNTAIDDFLEVIDRTDREEPFILDMYEIEKIAEQLKAGASDGNG